jgi:hypothetical protein
MSVEDPELQRMLALYREQRSPEAEQKARVWDAVDARLAPEPASDPTPTAAPTGSSPLAPALIAALVLIGAGAMLWIGSRQNSQDSTPAAPQSPPHESRTPHESSPLPVQPASATRSTEPALEPASHPLLPPPLAPQAPAPAWEDSPEQVPVPVDRASRAPREPARVSAQARAEQPGTLAAELALLQAAQSALDSERPARALRALRRHGARFADGALAEEREAALVETFCMLGRAAEARRAAERFAARFPASPRIARVQAQCEPTVEQP